MTAVIDPGTVTEVLPTPSAVALRVVGARRVIAGRAVVDGVDLVVGSGELVTVVGPSGCGKSTLLRAIAGLEPQVTGTIAIDGVDVSSLPPERRRVGLVFQDHALFPHLRVEANIAFGLNHLGRAERRRVVAEMLDLVRLAHVGRRYPHELSGGEQQRIALARALAPAPSVVLLDEPFASLDMTLRDDLRSDVVSALRERGATAVIVTHDRDEALLVGDRLAVMRAGRVVQVGTPVEIYERPVDRFVAGFMGPVTFWSTDGSRVATSSPAGRDLVARPHHLGFSDDPGSGRPGTVAGVAFLGSVWRAEVLLDDGTVALVDTDRPVAVGDRMSVVVRRGDLDWTVAR